MAGSIFNSRAPDAIQTAPSPTATADAVVGWSFSWGSGSVARTAPVRGCIWTSVLSFPVATHTPPHPSRYRSPGRRCRPSGRPRACAGRVATRSRRRSSRPRRCRPRRRPGAPSRRAPSATRRLRLGLDDGERVRLRDERAAAVAVGVTYTVPPTTPATSATATSAKTARRRRPVGLDSRSRGRGARGGASSSGSWLRILRSSSCSLGLGSSPSSLHQSFSAPAGTPRARPPAAPRGRARASAARAGARAADARATSRSSSARARRRRPSARGRPRCGPRARQAHFLEVRLACCGEGLVAQIGERGAAPERERFPAAWRRRPPRALPRPAAGIGVSRPPPARRGSS